MQGAEKAKWIQHQTTTKGSEDDNHPADDEESDLPVKSRPKVPTKKVPPPIKKLFLDGQLPGKLSDATPSTAD